MSISILLTSAKEDSEKIIKWINQQGAALLHLPLERYAAMPVEDRDWKDPEEFENIVYGNKRNAKFFLKEVARRDVLESIKSPVNITLDSATADYLEEAGIPAISTFGESTPINLVEFMLRLRRIGPTLYPCSRHTREEIPGFLEELDIPVHELELYDLEGPTRQILSKYRKLLADQVPDIVIFHSRRSVTRFLAAFPSLELSSSVIIAGDVGVSLKLAEAEIPVTAEAEGSWESIMEKLSDQI